MSFLLITFNYTRVQAIKSGVKALLVNKIGDFALLFVSALIFLKCKTLSFPLVFYLLDLVEQNSVTLFKTSTALTELDLICLALLLAAAAKSAQLFFHTWLPDAMEGPTPVSALLHAATMVTAGVFLIVRFSHCFEASSISRNVMFVLSVLTIFASSLIAMFQFDIKKIVAYSTCSQIGYMFLACSCSAYNLALFHFFNHAFFKCALFLLSGAIIHSLRGEQDIRKMGGL
jgi:NADH-quinone oxidoreductase subunit L